MRLSSHLFRTALVGCALITAAIASSGREPGVEIRRTTDGIPHILAADWRGLGLGAGYAQAQDALCTLADAFLTYEGRRSAYFGAQTGPRHPSTLGKPANVDSDVFFLAYADAEMVATSRAQQPAELDTMITGFAQGYNRRLAEWRRVPRSAGRPACVDEPWVREIGPDDVYRRLFAARIAAGMGHFIGEIAKASPGSKLIPPGDGAGSLPSRLRHAIGDVAGLGSNMIALGREVTGEEGSVLFGNPHWYWSGPDRFYQMHLTLPGRMNVAGVSFLGIPLVMIGFNDHVAWSHTVSRASRFGLFDLTLDPSDPARYLVDGRSEPMQARTVVVERLGQPPETRTLYSTRFGPVLDLGAQHAAFGWGTAHAVAMRDVNAENHRTFRAYFEWGRAASLDEFMTIQRREAAVPWVNTAAIGRGDGRVWYADMGPVPDVPDALRRACATPLANAFASFDAATPFLDGSRSDCQWQVEEAAVQPGTVPAQRLPALLREDHVANMNDSHWLTNPRLPLEGFSTVMGGEREALSLRGRHGHDLVSRATRGERRGGRALSHWLMREVLSSRSASATLFKDELLAPWCTPRRSVVMWRGDDGQQPASPVDVASACKVLRGWGNAAGATHRGALLWDSFWARLRVSWPGDDFFQVPFDPADPLATPRAPNGADPRVGQALASTVRAFVKAGRALDEPVGRKRFVISEGQHLSLYGGCDEAGYFTIACGGDAPMGPRSHANTYMQVVRFGPRGVEAHTLLAHGLKETAVTGGAGGAPLRRYARQAWLPFPFREADIASDPALTRHRLAPP